MGVSQESVLEGEVYYVILVVSEVEVLVALERESLDLRGGVIGGQVVDMAEHTLLLLDSPEVVYPIQLDLQFCRLSQHQTH